MADRTPPSIFSKRRRTARAMRAAVRQKNVNAARFIFDEIVEDIFERLAFIRAEPRSALVLGGLTGAVAARLEADGTAVTSRMIGTVDEELPLPGAGFDLIISINSLDSVNDLPGALIHLRNALVDGGMMIAVLPAAGSLPVLRNTMLVADGQRPAARIHPMLDAKTGAALMQRAGFSRQVADDYTIKASYRSLDGLVADLRDQGLTNVLSSTAPPLSNAMLQTARTAFLTDADEAGRVTERFEILTLTGWKS